MGPAAHLPGRPGDGGARTNLTVRQLAAVFDSSKSQAHRIIHHLTPLLAGLLEGTVDGDRRWSWTVDGTLIPTRDHTRAGKSKNYRYATNAQILSRRADLLVIAVVAAPATATTHCTTTVPGCSAAVFAHGGVLADGGYRGLAQLHTPVFAGGRIVRDARWRQHRRRRARAAHCIARPKDWQILRDHRRQGRHLPDTPHAVAYLHNLRILQPR